MLGIRKHPEYIAAWIAFVVGVHLLPLAVILEIPALHVVAALITAASIAAVWFARARSITVSAVVGATTGPILLVAAVLSLIGALTR